MSTWMISRFILVSGLWLAISFQLFAQTDEFEAVHSGERFTYCLLSEEQSIHLELELAITPAQRARGLMYRESVAANQGMLFIYERPRYLGFWMLNTLIPLDIAYLDIQGEIRQIGQMQPCESQSCPAYRSEYLVNQALEMAAGEFARLGIEVGDQLVAGACNAN